MRAFLVVRCSALALAVVLPVVAFGQAAGDPPADPFKPMDPKAAEAVAWLDEQAAAQPRPIPQDPARAKVVRDTYLAWYRKSIPEAFERVGNAKAAWAAKAKHALDLRSQQAAMQQVCGARDATRVDAAYLALGEAVAAGCDDPLVLYFWLQERHSRREMPDGEFMPRYAEAVERVYTSGYANVRKLHAAYNLLNRLHSSAKTIAEKKSIKVWDDRVWELLTACAADPDPLTQVDVGEIASLRMNAKIPNGTRTREQAYTETAAMFKRENAAPYTQLLFDGQFLISHAWDARGYGVAGSVTQDGWRNFHSRLLAAKAALTKAWEADPLRDEAPTEMIMVCMGLSTDRAEMETWFERAMKANPDCVTACQRKLAFLLPKWGGSMEDHLGFGWQCVRTRNLDGWVAWAAVAYHAYEVPTLGQRFEAERDGVRRFYEHPVIWQQVATTCELWLARETDDRYVRSMYARLACIAGRYDVANREFDRLGDAYWPSVFPTRPEYEYFRKWAKDKAPPRPAG